MQLSQGPAPRFNQARIKHSQTAGWKIYFLMFHMQTKIILIYNYAILLSF